MATQAFKNILAKMNGGEMKPYRYHDHGSLVSWSRFSTVGSLMGNLMRGSMMVEGYIARIVYISSTGCTRSPCTATSRPASSCWWAASTGCCARA
jgi:NADH dehydrogenase FAD-containing subunit